MAAAPVGAAAKVPGVEPFDLLTPLLTVGFLVAFWFLLRALRPEPRPR